MKIPYLRRKSLPLVSDVRSGTADKFYQTVWLAAPILINGFLVRKGNPVPKMTIGKKKQKATQENAGDGILSSVYTKGALVFVERGGEKRKESYLADHLPRQSRVCRILCIDAGRGCRIIAAP